MNNSRTNKGDKTLIYTTGQNNSCQWPISDHFSKMANQIPKELGKMADRFKFLVFHSPPMSEMSYACWVQKSILVYGATSYKASLCVIVYLAHTYVMSWVSHHKAQPYNVYIFSQNRKLSKSSQSSDNTLMSHSKCGDPAFLIIFPFLPRMGTHVLLPWGPSAGSR